MQNMLMKIQDSGKVQASHASAFTLTTMLTLLFIVCKKRLCRNQRPMEPWAFRSVLDKNPEYFTLALNKDCYVAYDLARCTIYKAWKGRCDLEGAAYTDKKMYNRLPWEQLILKTTARIYHWVVKENGKRVLLP